MQCFHWMGFYSNSEIYPCWDGNIFRSDYRLAPRLHEAKLHGQTNATLLVKPLWEYINVTLHSVKTTQVFTKMFKNKKICNELWQIDVECDWGKIVSDDKVYDKQ